MKHIYKLSNNEFLKFGFFFVVFGLVMGLTTTIIPNGIWIRMIGLEPLDYVVFILYLPLFAFYFALSKRPCAYKVQRVGGPLSSLFGFLGFACPTCNVLLMSVFGASWLLKYFEPFRHPLGFVGIGFLVYFNLKRLAHPAV